MKRFLCLLVALLMLAATVACNGSYDEDSRPPKKEKVSAAESSFAEETYYSEDISEFYPETSSEPEYIDGFLNEWINFDWQDINILSIDFTQLQNSELTPDRYNGDPVNTAFYERNELIRNKFGLNICGELVSASEAEDIARADIMSTHRYNAFCLPVKRLFNLAADGFLTDLAAVGNGYIHIGNPWWDQNMIRDLSFGDHVYFLTGDALITDDINTYAVMFNKNIAIHNNLGDLYQAVNDHAWTVDKMFEMAKKVSYSQGKELSLDPESDDVVGLAAQLYDIELLMLGAGQKKVDNFGDYPALRIATQENISVFDELFGYMSDNKSVGVFNKYIPDGAYTVQDKIIRNGRAMFVVTTVANALYYNSNSGESFGLLPLPGSTRSAAFGETGYTSTSSAYWCNALAIPATCADLDVTCYALEAMAYYGREANTAFYDYLSNEFNDIKMYDVFDNIFRNRTYDIGNIMDFNLYSELLGSNSSAIMSKFESEKEKYQEILDDLAESAWN